MKCAVTCAKARSYSAAAASLKASSSAIPEILILVLWRRCNVRRTPPFIASQLTANDRWHPAGPFRHSHQKVGCRHDLSSWRSQTLLAVIARSGATKQSRREGSVCHGGLRRIHNGLPDIRADISPYCATGDRREAVMETGVNAGVGDFVGKGPETVEAMRDPGGEGARQCHLGDLVAAEQSLDHRCSGSS